MAVGGAAGAVALGIQYGLPAAIELIKLGTKWADYFREHPVMSQAEYDAKWAEMQADYRKATDAHEQLRLQGR